MATLERNSNLDFGDLAEFMDQNLPDRPLSKKEELALKAKARKQAEQEQEKGAPPVPFEPRCDCCTSPYRHFIDSALIKGASYSSISEQVPGLDGKKIGRGSVSNHAKNHLGYEEAALRQVLEDEARQASQNYEEGVRGAYTRRGLLETLTRKYLNDLHSGIATVETRDVLSAIQILEKLDQQSSQVAVDQMRAELQAFIDAVMEVVGDQDTWRQIAYVAQRNLERNQELPAIEAQVVG